MKKLAITLSDDDFSMLEELCKDYRYGRKNKSNEIAWLIKEEWARLQEEKREKTPAELLIAIKINALRYEQISASRLVKKGAYYDAPCADNRIIQFPVRQIRQFPGSA